MIGKMFPWHTAHSLLLRRPIPPPSSTFGVNQPPVQRVTLSPLFEGVGSAGLALPAPTGTGLLCRALPPPTPPQSFHVSGKEITWESLTALRFRGKHASLL